MKPKHKFEVTLVEDDKNANYTHLNFLIDGGRLVSIEEADELRDKIEALLNKGGAK